MPRLPEAAIENQEARRALDRHRRGDEHAVDHLAENGHIVVCPADVLVGLHKTEVDPRQVAERNVGSAALRRIRLGEHFTQAGATDVLQEIPPDGNRADGVGGERLVEREAGSDEHPAPDRGCHAVAWLTIDEQWLVDIGGAARGQVADQRRVLVERLGGVSPVGATSDRSPPRASPIVSVTVPVISIWAGLLQCRLGDDSGSYVEQFEDVLTFRGCSEFRDADGRSARLSTASASGPTGPQRPWPMWRAGRGVDAMSRVPG